MEFVVAALVVVVFSKMDQGLRSLEKKIPFLRFKKLFLLCACWCLYVHTGPEYRVLSHGARVTDGCTHLNFGFLHYFLTAEPSH